MMDARWAVVACFALVIAASGLAPPAAIVTQGTTAAPGAGPMMLFADDFESDRGWGMFEEIVNGNPCYGDGIGNVTRSPVAARDGDHGLLVAPNTAGSTSSNHVIAQLRTDLDLPPGILRYEMDVRIDAASANTTQGAPEFSIQDTFQAAPGLFLTRTAGFQVVASPHDAPEWHVWTTPAVGPGAWVAVHEQRLPAGQWMRASMDVDMEAGVYHAVRIDVAGNLTTIDLSGLPVPVEAKGWLEEGQWLSVEAENLWNNCGVGGPTGTNVHVDNVVLRRR